MARMPLALVFAASVFGADVLMVADEFPAMRALAKQLQTRTGVDAEIIAQDALPPKLSRYSAVFVYIHRDITPAAEQAFIAYARDGGRLILLHHSISSGKRKNKEWLPFLGVVLPERAFEQGGYKYFDPATFYLQNVAPAHPVMKGAPARIEIWDSEVYINQELSPAHTTLLAIRYLEPESGVTYEQPTGGWYMRAGLGDVFYFMPGHNATDFEQPDYAQIIANAVRYRRE